MLTRITHGILALCMVAVACVSVYLFVEFVGWMRNEHPRAWRVLAWGFVVALVFTMGYWT